MILAQELLPSEEYFPIQDFAQRSCRQGKVAAI
jgi:hypothetical protein